MIKSKPYYCEDGITIYNGDCLEVMKQFDDDSFDLVLTDPPYGVRKKEKWDSKDAFLSHIGLWLKECNRLSKTVLWFCAGVLIPVILSYSDNFSRLLIWDKLKGSQFAGSMHSNIWYSIEPILVFGQLPKTVKTKRYGYASFGHRPVPYKKFGHPTTKPIELMEELIYFYSNEGDIILDPFMGSGTTLAAAKRLKRKAVGIELSEKYCRVAIKRLKSVQPTIFDNVKAVRGTLL